MKNFFLLLSLLLPLWATAQPGASSLDAQFDAANKLYAQNKFAEAATAYEQIITGGAVSPALYFNLGNAHFKAGQLGWAINAYRNAQELAPRDPDIRANLQFARNRVQGPRLTTARWQTWLGSLTANEWATLVTISVWLMLGLLIARCLRPAWTPALRLWTLVSFFVTAGIFVVARFAMEQQNARFVGIVTVADATIRNSPLDESPSAFTVHDGAELRVLDHKDEWLQITDDNHRFGWVKRSAMNWSPVMVQPVKK
ncbi:MAG: tetratricopeptide repeat protein [Verrucomicrobiota bacterium]